MVVGCRLNVVVEDCRANFPPFRILVSSLIK